MSMFASDKEERAFFEEAMKKGPMAAPSVRSKQLGAGATLGPRVVALLERASYLNDSWDLVARDQEGNELGRVHVRDSRLRIAGEAAKRIVRVVGDKTTDEAIRDDDVWVTLTYLRRMSLAPKLRSVAPEPNTETYDGRGDGFVSPRDVYIAEWRERAWVATCHRARVLRGIDEYVNCAVIDPDRSGAASALWADPTVMARPQTHGSWAEIAQRLSGSYFRRMMEESGAPARGLVLRDRVFALGLCPFGSYTGLIVGSSSELGRIASVVRNATESAPRQAVQSVC